MSIIEPRNRKSAKEPCVKCKPVVTWRALLLGTLMIPFNCWWLAVMEIQWNSVDATCVSLFFHVVFVIFLLSLVNIPVRRRWPQLAFTHAELMVIFIMLSVASAIMGRDSLENLLPILGHPFWFADESNNFARFHKFIPSWFAPHGKSFWKDYMLGGGSIWNVKVLLAWLPAIITWSGFTLLLVMVMLSINVIVRKHWMDRERLTFPTVQMPVQMTKDPRFFSNRLLWLGFAIPFAINLVNGLNYLYPSVPYLNVKLQDIGRYFANRPWNGVGWFPISFYPFAIGLAFFLPLDLSFSCWFFYIFRKLEGIACVAWGLKDPGVSPALAAFPYEAEQGAGAWIGLCVFVIWAGRKYIREALRRVKSDEYSDEGELLSYRTAIAGVVLGFTALCAFCVLAGMSLWVPPVFFMLYFLLSIGITRIRAELGPPAHELNWIRPEQIMVNVIGTSAFGVQNLTVLSYMFWFNRGYRSHPMPHQLEGMKIGRDAQMEPKRLLLAIVVASVVGAFASILALLHVYYQNGQATAKIMSYSTGIGMEAFNRLNDWTLNPRPPDSYRISFTFFGFAFTVLLMYMKSLFFWWPFHPAGYALANSYALEYWWLTLFIGWAIKSIIVRYSGIKGYRLALPFFMGLILGDYVSASLWSIYGWIMGISVYRVFIF